MLEDKNTEWKLNLDLPDFESIFVLTAVTIVSGLFVAVSLLVAFPLTDGYFEGRNTLETSEGLDGYMRTAGDTLSYVGGFIFAISAILFFSSFLKSLEALYEFTMKGGDNAVRKLPLAVKSLYRSVWVGGFAVLLIFIGIIITQIYDLTADYLFIGGL